MIRHCQNTRDLSLPRLLQVATCLAGLLYGIAGCSPSPDVRSDTAALTGVFTDGIDGDTVSLRAKGAGGRGLTDDTAAFAAAIATGKDVVCQGGDTYLIDGGTAATAPGQTINMTGCKLRLKSSATICQMLSLTAPGQRVVGGDWDMNGAGNPSCPSPANGFNIVAIAAHADRQIIEQTYVHDSPGLCVTATGRPSHFTARDNRWVDCLVLGIFVGSLTADITDTTISDNYVSGSAPAAWCGISVFPSGDEQFQQRRIKVTGNTVLGPLTAATGAGITVRATESLVSGNVVRGTALAITIDHGTPQNCAITGNNLQDMSGSLGFGIEINGGYCTVSNNYVRGGSYGITGSAQAGRGEHHDHLVISSNVLIDQAVNAISFGISSGGGTPAGETGRYMEIADNSIAPSGKHAIILAGDVKYSHIHGNLVRGPGSATPGSRGIFLDEVNSDVRIQGNRFIGVQRAVTLYNTSGTPQERITFDDNDVSVDVGSTTDLLNVGGNATLGASTRISGNYTGSPWWSTSNNLDVNGQVLATGPAASLFANGAQTPNASLRMRSTSVPSANAWQLRIRDLIEGDFEIYDETHGAVRLYIDDTGLIEAKQGLLVDGHFNTGGNPPALLACGAGGALSGTDRSGTVMPGAGATACTIRFQTAYRNDPHCVVTSQTANTIYGYSHSPTALVISGPAIDSRKFDYMCDGAGS